MRVAFFDDIRQALITVRFARFSKPSISGYSTGKVKTLSNVTNHGGGFDLIAETPGCSGQARDTDLPTRWRGVFSDVEGTFAIEFGLDSSLLHARVIGINFRLSERFRRLKRKACKVQLKYYCRLADPEDWDPNALFDVGQALPSANSPRCQTADKTPAAYTYLGQFIAHDISNLGVLEGDSTELRTSAFDLDSVFGAGETAEYSNEYWCGGVGVGRCGPQDLEPKTGRGEWSDIARTKDGAPRISDTRNADNLGVHQIHVIISRFHQLVTQVHKKLDRSEQETITRRHIQALILNDYLPRVVDQSVLHDVLSFGRRIIHPGSAPLRDAFLVPIEFSGAAFRIGHSMIRQEYPGWQPDQAYNALLQELILQTKFKRKRLSLNWDMPWDRMVWDKPDTQTVSASAFDGHLVPTLHELNDLWTSDFARSHALGPLRNLGTISMARNEPYRMASAQAVLAQINRLVSPRQEVPVLQATQLTETAGAILGAEIEQAGFASRTPLYLYCLLESQREGGQRMGPLTSRIVVETIHAAIAASRDTVLDSEPSMSFQGDPELGTDRDFSFRDLVDLVASRWTPHP